MIASRIAAPLAVIVLLAACSDPAADTPAAPSAPAAPAPSTPEPAATPEPKAGPEPAAEPAAAPAPAADPVPVAQLDDRAEPLAYRLALKADPDAEGFFGDVDILVAIKRSTETLWMHGLDLDVGSVTYTPDGGAAIAGTYEQAHGSGVAKVSFPSALAAGKGTLRFVWRARYGRASAGLYIAEEAGKRYLVSQAEAIDARRILPSFDEPRFKTPFSVAVTAPSAHVVITNAAELETSPAAEPGWTQRIFATTRPLPTYLLAFAIGPYDLVAYDPIPPNAVRAEPMPLRAVAAQGKGARLGYALKNTAGIMDALELYFGVPYPYGKLDLIAAPEFAFGAMENAGAIVYRDSVLILDDASPLTQKRGFAGTHAHELAHQWFGDLVTPVWWDDIWLNESFATWMAAKAVKAWAPSEPWGSQIQARAQAAMRDDALSSARQIRETGLVNDNVEQAFDAITYSKGGGVLSMFESYMGEEAFRKGVQLHIKRFADKSATSSDFFNSLAEGSGKPEIVPALRSFVDQPGLPLIRATLDCSGGAPKAKLAQQRYRPLGSKSGPATWQAPVCVSYPDAGATKTTCMMLSEPEASLPLETAACPSSLMPNAGGAGYYRFALDEAGWAALLARFDQLPASEALAVVDNLIAAFEAGEASAQAMLGGAAAAAKSTDWEVATAPLGAIGRYDRRVLDESGRQALAAFVRKSYGARFAALPRPAAGVDQLLAQQLLGALALAGRDPELRAKLAAAAKAFIASGGSYEGVDLQSYEMPTALRVMAEEADAAAVDALLGFAKTARDPLARRSAVSALGVVRAPELAAKVRASAAAEMQPTDMIAALGVALEEPETREATWAWFPDNFEAIAKRVPSLFGTRFVRAADGFCSTAKAAEVKAFFDARAAQMPGAERPLAQTVEEIELCAALKDAKGAELAAALAAMN